MKKQLWWVTHRPKTAQEYVWRDQTMRDMFNGWLADGSLPHCLFAGPPGTGKTSMAHLLLDLLQIPREDVLEINASRERKVEDLQDKIINFIAAWAFNPSGLKYILLDEADKLSATAQGLLRGEIVNYTDSCRFILTCNYRRQIIPALHSRLVEVTFDSLSHDEFALRAAAILDAEQVGFDPDMFMRYVNSTYPDLRKCLNVLQQNSRNGELQEAADTIEGTKDYLVDVIQLFKAQQYLKARELLTEKATPEEYPTIYRFFYEHIDLFGDDERSQTKALTIIRDALRDHAVMADPEINLSACIAELCMLASE